MATDVGNPLFGGGGDQDDDNFFGNAVKKQAVVEDAAGDKPAKAKKRKPAAVVVDEDGVEIKPKRVRKKKADVEEGGEGKSTRHLIQYYATQRRSALTRKTFVFLLYYSIDSRGGRWRETQSQTEKKGQSDRDGDSRDGNGYRDTGGRDNSGGSGYRCLVRGSALARCWRLTGAMCACNDNDNVDSNRYSNVLARCTCQR
jgi:hypothetical protein